MYKGFAQIYDEVMNNVPYEDWAGFITRQIYRHLPSCEKILDCACGTGTLINILERNFSVSGLDISPEMIKIASEKNPDSPLWVADMKKDLLTHDKFDCILCIYDSINYICTPEELLSFFRLAADHLTEDGLLIFDMITSEKIRSIFRDGTFTYEDRNIYYIWYNCFITQSIFKNTLDFFVKQPDDSYRRITEIHKRRLFSEKEIKKALIHAGFKELGRFDDFSENQPDKNSERIIYVVKREEQ